MIVVLSMCSIYACYLLFFVCYAHSFQIERERSRFYFLFIFMMITKPNQGSILVINFSVGKQEVNQASVST